MVGLFLYHNPLSFILLTLTKIALIPNINVNINAILVA